MHSEKVYSKMKKADYLNNKTIQKRSLSDSSQIIMPKEIAMSKNTNK